MKPATQQTAPRAPKPGGVAELFTGDLEKDKKIKNIHKVNERRGKETISHLFFLEITRNQNVETTFSKWRQIGSRSISKNKTRR